MLASRRMRTLRILLTTPAYWPATSFGGPIPVVKELAEGLAGRGHDVVVLSTSIVDLASRPTLHTRTLQNAGVTVRYLATPLRYRWMGFAPSALLWATRHRPDVVHVLGYRDPLGSLVAWWCRRRGVPYLFEPLGMFEPRFRKVRTKRVFDALVGRRVAERAVLVVSTSELERGELVASGLDRTRVVVRPNGFPPPRTTASGDGLRESLRLASDERLLLFVGRVNRKKGLDLLLRALPGLPGAHLGIVGPDDRDGTVATVNRLRRELGLERRVHLLGPVDPERLEELYADADVFVLPSRNENFGNVAAEAAAAGTAIVLTDQCGVAELLRERAALVVRPNPAELQAAVKRVLGDERLRLRLASEGPRVAEELSWANVCGLQEQLYVRALAAP